MRTKRVFLGVIVALLLSVLFCFSAGAVEYYEDGDYTFEVNTEENYAAVYAYTGTASDVVIPSYYNGYPVKVIKDMAFMGTRTLESVVIPETVEIIENPAFSFCVNLKSVTIEGNITEIPKGCFQYCHSLEKVVVPDSVKKIGELAFKFCFALTDFEFDVSIEEIGEQAFYGVETGEYLLIKNRNITIGEKAIGYIISEVDKPKVYAVTDFLFNYTVQPDDTWETVLTLLAEKLETVENIIPVRKLQKIFGYAGSGAESYAATSGIEFYNIDSYTDESGLVYSFDITDMSAAVTGYEGTGTEVAVPSNVLDFEVVEIAEDAFLWNENIVSISVPGTVKSIGDFAFVNCTSLKSVMLGEGLLEIGEDAFDSCVSLENIVIPDSVITIKEYAFESCENLKKITFGSSLKVIENNAFTECISLENFTLPENLKKIGNEAFFACTSLENVVIPESVETFGDAVFAYCTGLKSAEIQAEIERVPGLCFGYCYSLESIVLSKEVKIIGTGAFGGCFSLAEMPYSDSIVELEEGAFASTFKDKDIVIKNRELIIGEMALGYIFGKEADVDLMKRYVDLEILLSSEENYTEELEEELNELEARLDNLTPDLEGYTIYGYTGSTAEAYANANGIKFVALDGECPHTGGEATCENLAVCTLCGEEYGELAEHTPSTISKSSTCTVAGYSLTICTMCGDTISYELGTPLGHDMQGVTNNKNGSHTINCLRDNCNNSETKDCSFGTWIITELATCEDKGFKVRICSVCSFEETEEITTNGHSEGATTKENIIPATCENDGSYDEVLKCTVCTKELSRKNVIENKLGHDMGEWNVTKTATLLEEGLRTRKCSRCPETETESIEKLPGNTTKDKKSDIEIKYPDDAYDGKEMEVRVEEDYTGAQYIAQSLGVEYSGSISFNIKTYVDGKEAQPSAPVLVRIPLPNDFNTNKVAIYHVNTNTGVFERITPIYIIDGYIEFLATSFSYYVAIDESTEIIPEDPKEPSDNCTHICHEGGFMGFIWKILRFFYKIFGMNKTCDCGIAHY